MTFIKQNFILSNFFKFLDDHLINKNICIRTIKKFYSLIYNENEITDFIKEKIKAISEQKDLDCETRTSITSLKQWLIFYEFNPNKKFKSQIEQDNIKYEEEEEMRKKQEKPEELFNEKKIRSTKTNQLEDTRTKYKKPVVS